MGEGEITWMTGLLLLPPPEAFTSVTAPSNLRTCELTRTRRDFENMQERERERERERGRERKREEERGRRNFKFENEEGCYNLYLHNLFKTI